MKRIITHILLPSLAPILIICLYFTPKEVFGCANRGLMALAIAFAALLLAFVTVSKAISENRLGASKNSYWWIVATFILLTPILLLLGPLG